MKHPKSTAEVVVHNADHLAPLLGSQDEHLLVVERAFPDTSISVRGNVVEALGPDAAAVARLFDELLRILDQGDSLDGPTVSRTIQRLHHDNTPTPTPPGTLLRSAAGKPVRATTTGQLRYCEAIAKSTITFGLGPAGTGKSYLAVAAAVAALQQRQVRRIVLTRPAVEAGERLGFLPGDLTAKVDPYLRPLYDALFEMLGPEVAQRHVDKGIIEIAPLAFMRGRTLNDAFVILDEAQNTTPEQMKMFLTRIGFGSKVVVTGDGTQVDLPGGRSGLSGLEGLLGHIPDISFVHLNRSDVVRHRVVADIIEAYETREATTAPPKR